MFSGTAEPGCRSAAGFAGVPQTRDGATAPPHARDSGIGSRRAGLEATNVVTLPPFTRQSMARRRPGARTRPTRSRCSRGVASNGFREFSAGDQLRSNVCRLRVGTDAGRRRGLGRIGRRTAFGGQLVSIRGLGIDRRAMAGSVVSVDELPRPRPMSAWLTSHRHAGRGDGRPGQSRGRRVPDGVYLDGAAADGRRQPQSANDAGGDEPVRPKHAGDRGKRGAVRRDVGPGCRGDVRLRSVVGIRDKLTPFTPPQQNTNAGGSASQAAAVSQATGTSAGNAQSTVSSIQQAFSAVPNALKSAATSAPSTPDPLGPISDLISIFFDLPADLATFLSHIPLGTLGICRFPSTFGGRTGVHTDDIISGWAGEQAGRGTGPRPSNRSRHPCSTCPRAPCRRPASRPGSGKRTRSEDCRCRRRGPSPPRRYGPSRNVAGATANRRQRQRRRACGRRFRNHT